MKTEFARFLAPTEFLDWKHDAVQQFTESATRNATDSVDKACRIFTAVRDSIWYDPYSVSDDPRQYRASAVAVAERAYCVPKAVLLTAACRAAGFRRGWVSPTSATIYRPRVSVNGWVARTFSSTTATVKCC
ncbi:transglutaminase-like superfamily protein [Mycobacterium intracellulare MIN_052511_1280]|nr:transglutaminase-like superfamily protein [Mycobacterium intracellulare MIN_052511_1280]